jgi:hypothetical protein
MTTNLILPAFIGTWKKQAMTSWIAPADQGDIWTRDLRGDAWIRWEERKLIRREILAIAAELKAQ